MLTQAKVKGILNYNKGTGKFTWKVSIRRMKIGDIAGCTNSCGYRYISIGNKLYSAHRLAWLYATGKFPENNIDHINGIRDDNRLVNLRDITHIENCRNRSLNNGSVSGATGVLWNKYRNKWQAGITVGGKRKYLGIFANIEDAIAARQAANIKYGYHANHGKVIDGVIIDG